MSERPTSGAPSEGSQPGGGSAQGSQPGGGSQSAGGSQQGARRRRRSRSGSGGRGRSGQGSGGSGQGSGAARSTGEDRSDEAEDGGKRAPSGRSSTRGTGSTSNGSKAKGSKGAGGGAKKTSQHAKKASSGGKQARGAGASSEGAKRKAADAEARSGQRASSRAREVPGGPSEHGGGAHPGTRAHEAADRQNAARLAANRRRVRELTGVTSAVPAVVVGVVVGVTAGAVLGAVAGVVVLVCTAYLVRRGALGRALRVTGGRRVGPGELPGLANQVDGLCATIGVARPELWVLEDPVPNACSLDGPGSPGVLLVTAGLVGGLDRIELEGVLAHELVHLKRQDAVVSAVAVATVGALCAALGRDVLLHRFLGVGREYEADQAAALAVRYPPGLERALGAMAGRRDGVALGAPAREAARGGVFSGRNWVATRWIWIDPMAGEASESLEGELDATSVRREALAQW